MGRGRLTDKKVSLIDPYD